MASPEALIDWAQSRAQSSEVFIAGDFNFELKAANETNLYTDNVKHDSESYSHILRYFRDLGRAAGDTAINDRRIDYFFGPSKLRKTERAEVLRNTPVGRSRTSGWKAAPPEEPRLARNRNQPRLLSSSCRR